ncbi:MAG: hypothetical protein AB8B56_20515 [Crocinitomicaceae bacterium]
MRTGITFLIVAAIVVFVPSFTDFPWWSYLIPLFVLGILLPLQKWRVQAFLTAFLAGFLTWIGTTVYFENLYEGEVLETVSGIVDFPSFMVYIFIGLIGGLLSGLAVYAGFLLRRGREELSLDIRANDKSE